MPSFTPLCQTDAVKPSRDEDGIPGALQNIPSNLDLALNRTTNRAHLRETSKGADNSLLDPDAFRRLSISTISSYRRNRSISPFPHSVTGPRTWRQPLQAFWTENQGFFYVSFSQMFGALMNVTARLLELEGDGMQPMQILFVRQGLTAILCTLWMWWAQVPEFPLGARGVRGLLCARAFSGFFGIFGMYYSLQYLPVADAVVLTFLAPSVASAGCYFFLKESWPRSAQIASLFSLLGVVMIARPTSFFSNSVADIAPDVPANGTSATTTLGSDFPTPTSTQRLSAVLVALLGVLGSAGAFTSIRWIGDQAHPLLSVNYFSIFCVFVATVFLSLAQPLGLSSQHFQLPANLRQWVMLVFLGICGFIMQYLLTIGLAAGGRGNGARATNMIYTNMLFALAFDKMVFGASPGFWSLGGSALILGSAVYIAVKKQQEGNGGYEEVSHGIERGSDEEEEMGMMSGLRSSSEADRTIGEVGDRSMQNEDGTDAELRIRN